MDFKRKNGLGGGGQTIQVSTLPAASASELGKIYQYVGDTTSDYTNGYFYKCVESSGSYVWQVVDVDNSVPFSGVTGSPADNAALSAALNGKADASSLTAHTGDAAIHVTSADKTAWNGKAEKAANPTANHLAKLDANGNLVDAGFGDAPSDGNIYARQNSGWKTVRELPSGGSAGQIPAIQNDGSVAWVTCGEKMVVTCVEEEGGAVPSQANMKVQIINSITNDVMMEKDYAGASLTFYIDDGVKYKVHIPKIQGYAQTLDSAVYSAENNRSVSFNAMFSAEHVQEVGVMIMRDDGNFYNHNNWNTEWNNRALGIAIADANGHNVLYLNHCLSSSQYNNVTTQPILDPDTGLEYSRQFPSDASSDWDSTKNTDCAIYTFDRAYYDDNTIAPTYAAGKARNHTWADGAKGGDIPSAAQIILLASNLAAYNDLSVLTGGSRINFGTYIIWLSSYRGNVSGEYRVYDYLYGFGGVMTRNNLIFPVRNLPPLT